MTKLLAILTLIVLIGCEPMTIDYDYQKTYTETFTRTVGATERTGVRGTLPQPAPSDVNSIWLATNGNDGNAGTQTLPKLTLNGAIAALGGALTTVHIFRNSALGDLDFIETLASTLLSTHNIQVEDGEIAKFIYNTAVANPQLSLNGSNTINGIYFEKNIYDSSNPIIGIFGTTVVVDNCTFDDNGGYNGDNIEYGACVASNGGGLVMTFNNTAFYGETLLRLPTEEALTMNNSLMFYDTVFSLSGSINSGGLTLLTSAGFANGTFNIDRSLFVGFDEKDASAIKTVPINLIAPTPNPFPGPAINVDSSAFPSCSIIASANMNNIVIVYDYCQLYGVSAVTLGDPALTGIDVTNSNTLESTLPNMFHNEALALSGDVESFRLQRLGQTTPDGSGRYEIDSPLIGAGLAGDDVNPFDESIALNTAAFNKSLDLKWPNRAIVIENQYTNPVSLVDVNGNLHKSYDKVRRKFTMTWGDDIHLSNIQMKQISDLLGDNGSKRFFPVGIGSSLFDESGAGNGVFSDTDNSLSPVDAAFTPMVDGWWAGFWTQIGATWFYISSNDGTKLYLTDKLGSGFPVNGSHSFLIDSILVNNLPVAFPYKQNNFTQFTKGGFLRESTEQVRPYDYTIDQIILEEVEDQEENI